MAPTLLLACLLVQLGTARRSKVAQLLDVVDRSPLRIGLDCECVQKVSCSSCSFSSCPFSTTSFQNTVALAEGGTDRVHGVAAWKVGAKGGMTYVLKFGGGDQREPVRAAQLAHALGVVTPHQMIFDSVSCPELWDQAAATQVPDNFRKSLDEWRTNDKTILLQAWAGDVAVPESSLWYQVGGIASFDWLIGKSDLFNDVDLDFDKTPSSIEDTKSNWGNLIFEGDKCIEIDLSIGMAHTKYEYWEAALAELQAQSKPAPIEWVNAVLLPILSLIKSNGEQERALSAFPRMTGDNVNGFDPALSPLMIQLGMVDALIRALALLKEGSPRVHTLDGQPMPGFRHLQQAIPGNSSQMTMTLEEVKGRHSKVVNEQLKHLVSEYTKQKLAKELAGKRCCVVSCAKQRSRSLTNWSSQKKCAGNAHQVFKLVTTSYRPGSPMYRAYGNPKEQSCTDVFDKRKQEVQSYASKLCPQACGKDAEGMTITALTDGDFAACGK